MAGTITTRISLDGAEDIRKKLEELGAAGEKAFKQIQDAAAKPITNQAAIDRSKQAFEQLVQVVAKLSPQFKQLTSDTEAFGRAGASASQQVTSGLEQAGRSANILGVQIGIVSGVVQALTSKLLSAISALGALTTGAGETAQTISAQADKLSLTIPQWLKYRAAIDAAGGSQENFIKSTAPLIGALNKLSLETSGKTMQTFADGTSVTIFQMTKMSEETKKTVAELQKFGISLFDIRKGDSAAIMEQLAAAIAKMPASAQQAAAGVRFFGQDWKNTIATLTAGVSLMNDTRGAMGQMRIATRQMSTEQVTAAKNAADQWDDLGKAIRAIKDQIGVLFAGSSFARAEWLTHMVDDARILLTTFLKLDAAGRASFLAKLGDSAAETTFKVLVALGEQLAGIWNTLLVPAGEKLMGIFDGIAGIFEGITGSQVAAFFITAAIAAAGLALALKGIALILTPLSLLMSLVFSPFGAVLLAAAAAAALFWDELKAGAQTVAALIPAELAAIGQSFQKLFAGDFSGFWDQFSTAAVAAFQKIAAAAEANQGVVGEVFRGIKQIIKDLPGTIELVVKAFIGLGHAAQGVANIINRIFGTEFSGTGIAAIVILGQMTGVLGALAAALIVVSNGIGIFVTICTALGTVVAALLAPFVAVSASVAALVVGIALLAAAIIAIRWDSISSGVVNAWNAIVGAIQGAITAVGNFASSILTITWDAISSAGVAAWNAITGAINSAVEAVKNFLGLKGDAPAATGAQGFARGGMVGGRGSGTSDSNLAWVSRGEHIMPAGAVRQPGVLAFLEALRRSGGDLSRVIDRMGHFATGGLVGMPALAGGGLGGMSHVTIQFPSGPTIGGLRASSDVVEQLQRAAAMAQVRSGGRKPSRYG